MEVPRSLEAVEALHLYHGPEELVGDLVPPLVDLRLADVVNEDQHLLPQRWPKHSAHPPVHIALDALLEELGRGGGGEVAVHHQDVLRLVLLQEAVHQLRLGRALLPHQESVPANTHDTVDQELRPDAREFQGFTLRHSYRRDLREVVQKINK